MQTLQTPTIDDGTTPVDPTETRDSYLVVDLTGDQRWHTWSEDPAVLDERAVIGNLGVFSARHEAEAAEMALVTWHGVSPDAPGHGFRWNENELMVFCPHGRSPSFGDPAFAVFSLSGLMHCTRALGDEHAFVGLLQMLRADPEARTRLEESARGESDRERRWLRLVQAVIDGRDPTVYGSRRPNSLSLDEKESPSATRDAQLRQFPVAGRP